MSVTVHHGDCLDVLADLDPASVDSIVTDPPYGLSFMGRAWDHGVPGPDYWTACLRVLKPGGHLLAFGGTRTAHRLASAIEDAGFEIRDTITWLYGSGFPKSLDVSKAIDKAAGAEREVVGHESRHRNRPQTDQWQKSATVIHRDPRPLTGGAERGGELAPVTAPATDAARRWSGWGTALKPASEPIIVARKPFGSTVAACVLEHGTGAMNIDACRVAAPGETVTNHARGAQSAVSKGIYGDSSAQETHQTSGQAAGRWPTNVVFTHAPDCEQVGTRKVRTGTAVKRNGVTSNGATGWGKCPPGTADVTHAGADGMEDVPAFECVDGCPVAELDAQSGITGAHGTNRGQSVRVDREQWRMPSGGTDGRDPGTGGASRFFPTFRYQAKAPTKERPKVDGVSHPTVKPLALMRWLVRLVTPPGGTVLDPFAGSGTTGEAAALEGMRAVLIERDESYLPLITHRLERELTLDLPAPA